jgi:hypothetical protein
MNDPTHDCVSQVINQGRNETKVDDEERHGSEEIPESEGLQLILETVTLRHDYHAWKETGKGKVRL